MKRVILSLLIGIILFSGTINVFENKVKAESIQLEDAFDGIIIEDEEVPMHFMELEQTNEKNVCLVHFRIVYILIAATILMLIFRKKQKVYIIELGTVALLAVYLCVISGCKLDWIITIIGAVWLESMNIIFERNTEKNLLK